MLLSDLWGADGHQNTSAPWPGDNGDWTFYNDYLNHIISMVNKHNMTKNLVIDIWNEPDLGESCFRILYACIQRLILLLA